MKNYLVILQTSGSNFILDSFKAENDKGALYSVTRSIGITVSKAEVTPENNHCIYKLMTDKTEQYNTLKN